MRSALAPHAAAGPKRIAGLRSDERKQTSKASWRLVMRPSVIMLGGLLPFWATSTNPTWHMNSLARAAHVVPSIWIRIRECGRT